MYTVRYLNKVVCVDLISIRFVSKLDLKEQVCCHKHCIGVHTLQFLQTYSMKYLEILLPIMYFQTVL